MHHKNVILLLFRLAKRIAINKWWW